MGTMRCIVTYLVVMSCLLVNKQAFPWDNEKTHKDLSKIATEQSTLGKDNGDYLDMLGFNKGVLEAFLWNGNKKYVSDWLQEGAELEDAGKIFWDVPRGLARFNNHFHNPLKPRASAGLDDIQTGESSLLWAQDWEKQATKVGGDWSWSHIRGFYFRALTSTTDSERQAYFAQTFRGLGHQMHLLQDTAVPAHVRNDAHPLDATLHYHDEFAGRYFETWVKENSSDIKKFATNTVISPSVSFHVSNYDPTLKKELVPVTQLIDTDKYTGMNPSDGLSIGLAEYTNANFFSDDSIFAAERYAADADNKHFSPFPRENSTDLQSLVDQTLLPEVVIALDGKPDVSFWIKKIRDGEGDDGKPIDHFIKPSYTWMKLFNKIQIVGPVYRRAFYIDELCHEDYARLLIPRAVGYSTALLNYFFRGDINMKFDNMDVTRYVVSNESDEPLHGIFSLYYDDKSDNRILLKTSLISSGVSTLEAHSESESFSLDQPDANVPGQYMLVFRGTMGNESGAVVGRVVKLNTLEVFEPEGCLYSIIDGADLPQQFTHIKARVRNAQYDRKIQNGTLKGIAKYKKRIDYKPDLTTDPPTSLTTGASFSYSVSAPIPVTSLNVINPTEITLDFSGNPIPAGVTDLHLSVIFEGTIDDVANTAVAVGQVNLNEPMHHVVWNDTDRFYLNGNLYTADTIAGDPTLLQHLDGYNNNLINPFPVTTKISYCPTVDLATDANVIYDAMPPGSFGRVILLTGSDQVDVPIRIERISSNPAIDLTNEYSLPAVVNEQKNYLFYGAPVYTFRTIIGHMHSVYLNFHPTSDGMENVSWPVPVSINPQNATYIGP